MASREVGRYRERRDPRLARMHKVDPEIDAVIGGCTTASFLGIDISKETFYASLLSDRGNAKKVFPNAEKGFEQLTSWLRNHRAGNIHACMAAGSYWEALAFYLHERSQRVSVVNPARIASGIS